MNELVKISFQLVVELIGLAGTYIKYRIKNPKVKKVKKEKL